MTLATSDSGFSVPEPTVKEGSSNSSGGDEDTRLKYLGMCTIPRRNGSAPRFPSTAVDVSNLSACVIRNTTCNEHEFFTPILLLELSQAHGVDTASDTLLYDLVSPKLLTCFDAIRYMH